MRRQGDVEFEHLCVKDADLGYCRGCLNCFTKGESYCPLKDDRQSIEQKMLDADGVIFLSPNYAGNVSAMMKNFIDRFAYVGHRPLTSGCYGWPSSSDTRSMAW